MSSPCKHLEAIKLYDLLKSIESKGREDELESDWNSKFEAFKNPFPKMQRN